MGQDDSVSKGTCHQACCPEFCPQNPLEKKTEPWKLSPDPLTILWHACCHTHSLKKIQTMITFQCLLSPHFYLYFSNHALHTWVLNLLARCNTFSSKASYFAVLRQSFPHTRRSVYHRAAPLPCSTLADNIEHQQPAAPGSAQGRELAGWPQAVSQSDMFIRLAGLSPGCAPLWQLLEETSPSAVGRKLSIPTGDVALE